MTKPVVKPDEVDMVEEPYKAPTMSEAKRMFDRPDEYKPTPAKVSKPAKAPQPPPQPVKTVKTVPFKPREQSPRCAIN